MHLSLAVLCFAIFGCESDAPEFSASGFVSDVNARDAGLVLGDPLESVREEVRSYDVTFGHEGEGERPAVTHAGGTLQVTQGAESGSAEYERCERAATLVCYRAANIVVYFEGEIAPADLSAFESALRPLAAEGSGD